MHQTEEITRNGPDVRVKGESLMDVYNKFFFYRRARSAQDIEAAHRLRYQVYCEETGFLPKEDNPGGLERDRYDVHSLQSVLYHKPSGIAVGTVRVVLPLPDQPGSGQPARMYASALDALPESVMPRHSTGEISRFSIHESFRKRRGDTLYASLLENSDHDPRRIIPHMTLGLMTSIFEMTLEANLTHLCAIIDPALLRLLRTLGIHFEPVGPVVEFHGPRQPVFAPCITLAKSLREHHHELYRVISNDEHFRIDPLNAAI